jgi:lipid-binding SYLF domain-containing protein
MEFDRIRDHGGQPMYRYLLIRAVVLAAAASLAMPSAAATDGQQTSQQQQPPTTPPTVPQQKPDENIEDYVERIAESVETLNELTRIPADAIPAYLLQRAEAIVVIPSLVRGGFIIGAKHGKGVISVRNRATAAADATSSAWSAPAFVNLTGGSIGWQIGAESVDLVLLVMNREGIDRLLEDKFTLGGNLSVAAGPVGRSADAATNVRLDSQILAYSRAKGLFAGATFEGAALHANDSANKAFYGREISLREILFADRPFTGLSPIVSTWHQTLTSLASGK